MTRAMLPWSDDDRRTLVAMWNDGVPTAVIGAEIGKSKNAVIGMADRMKLPPRRLGVARSEFRMHDAYIRAAYLAGATAVEIVDKIGCNRGNIYRILRRNGVPARLRERNHADRGSAVTA